jgi:hypothetical protein
MIIFFSLKASIFSFESIMSTIRVDFRSTFNYPSTSEKIGVCVKIASVCLVLQTVFDSRDKRVRKRKESGCSSRWYNQEGKVDQCHAMPYYIDQGFKKSSNV